jgi:hypothetical protein
MVTLALNIAEPLLGDPPAGHYLMWTQEILF